jgi:hypothetical protein
MKKQFAVTVVMFVDSDEQTMTNPSKASDYIEHLLKILKSHAMVAYRKPVGTQVVQSEEVYDAE